MKTELERVKSDLETMQRAMGLTPGFGREWMHWLKRDNWLNLWWCLPGVILIGASLAGFDNTRRYLGLAPNQWVGLAVCAILLGMLVGWDRMTRSGRRPEAVLREYRRINAQSGPLTLAFLVQFALYLAWGKLYGIPGQAFMAVLFLFCGSAMLTLAICTRAWMFLGWAIPLLAFGVGQRLMPGRWYGVGFGLMFIVAALLCSAIQVWQLRGWERQNVTD